MTVNNQSKKYEYVHLFVPGLISMGIVFLTMRSGINYNFKNLDKVLEGTTNFSSILLGFLGALLGILLSIKDSDIVRYIFDQKGSSWLKFYFNESFIFGLIVVILSAVMQVFIDESSSFAKVLFLSWIFSLTYFMYSTFRIVRFLMKIFFNSNAVNANDRPESNLVEDDQQRLEMRNSLTQNNSGD